MSVFKLCAKKIVFRKLFVSVIAVLSLLAADFLACTAARSAASALQGYSETKCLDRTGIYISNLDPDSDLGGATEDESSVQAVYDCLDDNYRWAFYSYGFIAQLPNTNQMEIPLGYMNREYWELYDFELSGDADLDFDYELTSSTEIPVIVGAALGKEYPVGSVFSLNDPMLERTVSLKVQGILKPNACHSNYYDLNLKYYYNFSILIPVNSGFLRQANANLKMNGLNDLVVLDATNQDTQRLGEIIYSNVGLKFNFFTQKENFEFFTAQYLQTAAVLTTAAVLFFALAIFLAKRSASAGIRECSVSTNDCSLLKAPQNKLRTALYTLYSIPLLAGFLFTFVLAAVKRQRSWLANDPALATLGFLGLTSTDAVALLTVLILSIIAAVIVVQGALTKIRKAKATADLPQ